MAALSADRVTKSKGNLRRQSYPVAASTVIYAGAMVCIDADGYAIPAADTAGISDVVGIATAKQDNSSGSDGDIDVVVEYGGAFLLDSVTVEVVQANVGRDAVVTDDQTITDAAAGTNDIVVGRILSFDSANEQCWVNIDNS